MLGRVWTRLSPGLAREIGPVQRGQERLKEAAKLGFTQAVVLAANQPKQKIAGMTIHTVQAGRSDPSVPGKLKNSLLKWQMGDAMKAKMVSSVDICIWAEATALAGALLA